MEWRHVLSQAIYRLLSAENEHVHRDARSRFFQGAVRENGNLFLIIAPTREVLERSELPITNSGRESWNSRRLRIPKAKVYELIWTFIILRQKTFEAEHDCHGCGDMSGLSGRELAASSDSGRLPIPS
jgi:hypothetical protein